MPTVSGDRNPETPPQPREHPGAEIDEKRRAELESIRVAVTAPDEEVLKQCDVDTYRASGPGGQKRNKTSSAVRLRHRPSGAMSLAEETRSQHQNKARALQRLREILAIDFRVPGAHPIDWPPGLVNAQKRLRVGEKNPNRPRLYAEALDALDFFKGSLPETADFLRVTSSSLVRFLADHPRAWAAANRIRSAYQQSPLRAP